MILWFNPGVHAMHQNNSCVHILHPPHSKKLCFIKNYAEINILLPIIITYTNSFFNKTIIFILMEMNLGNSHCRSTAHTHMLAIGHSKWHWWPVTRSQWRALRAVWCSQQLRALFCKAAGRCSEQICHNIALS